MADDRILERERLQMEQIRELDMEELQVEEVEDAHSSSSDDFESGRGNRGADPYGDITFNPSLASMHTYLGEVEDTHHRLAFLDGGAILSLPMFYLEGVVLFPKATLPLRVIQPSFIAAVESALNQVNVSYTIGVIRVHRSPDDDRLLFTTIGTTAEIRQYRRLEDGSLNVVTRGQQRFRLRRRWIDVDGAPWAEVQIIQEDLPLRTPRDAFGQLAPVNNLWSCSLSNPLPLDARDEDNDSEATSETSFESDLSLAEMRMHHSATCKGNDRNDELISSDDDEFICSPDHHSGKSHLDDSGGLWKPHIHEKRKQFIGRQSWKGEGGKKWWTGADSHWSHRAARAFWPHWVYRMYDSYHLAQRAADLWRQIIRVPSIDDLVKKPDLLSFCIASKIPVSEATRQELLEIDGIFYRLRREIELLESFDLVRCRTCQTVIAKRSDMLVMSTDGPLSAYVNPHGHVHEIMTFYKTNSLALRGRPVKEFSWFPGYSWTITTCATCESQMGWLFTAYKKKLKPKSFWGIRSSQVADDMH